MGECQTEPLRPQFDRRLEFHGAKVTSDAGEGVERRCGGNPDGDSPSRRYESWRKEGSSAVAATGFCNNGRDLGRNLLAWRHWLRSNASWDHPKG
jgi:hypothetical protein